MQRAYVRIPHESHNRSISKGMEAAGFELRGSEFAPTLNDALVIWNRMKRDQALADRYQKAGAKIIVAENGYIGGDPVACKMIALSRTYHNGAGQWPQGDAERWSSMNVQLAPWRARGEHLLLLPQRGFGSPGVAMPPDWLNSTMGRLRRVTKRPLKIRRHPGQSTRSYEPDFTGAWACVTWASGAAIKALASGIPVFHDMPHWIGKDAALRLDGTNIEQPFLGDRLPMFHRLAWAQWSIREIESGEPLRRLIAL